MIDHDDIDRLNAQARARAEDFPRVTRRSDRRVFRIIAQARSPDGPVDLAAIASPFEHATVNGRDFARDFIDPRKEHAPMSTGIATDNGMNFGTALALLKAGRRVARAGWNGKGMWLCYMPETTIPAELVNGRTLQHVSRETLASLGGLKVGGYIVMWTAQGVWQPGWLASQADMLADDWQVVTS